MKKITTIFLLVVCAQLAFSQADDLEITPDPKGREKIKAAHAAYVTERLGLTPAEAERFWPIYREYAQKRQDLRVQYRDSRKTNGDEKVLLDQELQLKQQELDLERNYSGRFQEAISPQKVMKLRQAEGDFRRLLLQQIQQRQSQQDRQQQMRNRQQQRIQQRNN